MSARTIEPASPHEPAAPAPPLLPHTFRLNFSLEIVIPRTFPLRLVLEVLAVGLILVVALALRLSQLATIPTGLHGDEGIAGLEAARIIREHGIGPYSPQALGQPAGPLYVSALFVQALGNTILAVRLPSALIGTITILAFYLILRRNFGPACALCGAALLATSGWHLHFSRLAFPVIHWPLWTILSFGALAEALRQWSWRWWAATGAALAAGCYVYNSHPIFLGLTVLFLSAVVVQRLRRTTTPRQTLLPVLALPAVLLLVALPFILYALDPQHGFSSHFKTVSVTNLSLWQADPTFLGHARLLIARYLSYWAQLCFQPQLDGVDGSGLTPYIPPPILILAIIGAILGVANRQSRLLISYNLAVIAVMPLASALSIDGLARRTFALAPALLLLAAFALATPLNRRYRRWRAGTDRARSFPLLVAASIVFFLFLTAGTITTYFQQFAHSVNAQWTFGPTLTSAAQYLATLPPGTHVYFAAERWSGNYETRQYLAPNVRIDDRSTQHGQRTDLIAEPHEQQFVFVLLDSYSTQIDDLRTRYPNGTLIVGGPDDDPAFLAYRIRQAP